jgi:hypothetical protein
LAPYVLGFAKVPALPVDDTVTMTPRRHPRRQPGLRHPGHGPDSHLTQVDALISDAQVATLARAVASTRTVPLAP